MKTFFLALDLRLGVSSQSAPTSPCLQVKSVFRYLLTWRQKNCETGTPTVFNIKYVNCYFMSLWSGWKASFNNLDVIKSLKVTGWKDVPITSSQVRTLRSGFLLEASSVSRCIKRGEAQITKFPKSPKAGTQGPVCFGVGRRAVLLQLISRDNPKRLSCPCPISF